MARTPDRHPIGSAMDIRSFLSPDDCTADLRVSDKTRLLQELSRRAAEALQLPAERVSGEILKREQLGSTGMGQGVAIPHARLSDVSKPLGLFVRLKRQIDFEAIDGKPVDLVFLLLLPATAEGEQLNALAGVARKLRDPEIVRNLRHAADATELYRTMAQGKELKPA
jgi:PTS system nitrogen regulatory IIA component